jgi:galactose-1-phosphate uridylyltransferase
MTAPIEFRSDKRWGEFHDPRDGFKLNRAESEVRYDPLTGDSGRICHFSFDRMPPLELDAAIEATAANCPFCPDKVHEITPKFPAELIPEGRLRRGEAVIFPNLFPYDDVSAVGVISKAHFLPVHEAGDAILTDILLLAREFFERIEAARESDAAPSYAHFTWNYLPPAGGSQLHPHVQVIHTTRPANLVRRRLAAAASWRHEHGRPYAAELLDTERKLGDRWVGETGAVAWYVPYVPTGVLGDVTAIFSEKATFTDLSDADVTTFVRGLKRVLAFFAAKGLTSFNLAFAGDFAGAEADRHWLQAQIVPRLYVNPAMQSTDAAYLQMLWHEPFAMAYPEEIAAGLRGAMD